MRTDPSVIGPDRAVPLAGAANVRDLGGLRTADGRRVRAGRLLRADGLSRLTAADVELLTDRLGLRLVVDLRTPEEVEADGRGRLADTGVGYVNLPLRATGRTREDAVPDVSGVDLATAYTMFVEHGAAALAAVLERLAGPDGLPAVVHCTAGKDRTGIVVAVVLDLLGVPAEAIVADYAATGPNMGPIVDRIRSSALFRRMGVEEVPAWVFEAAPVTMQRFLGWLSDVHGGAAGWASAHGVAPATVDALRDALLEG